MTKRYTAADFANARFAEHKDGRLAVRNCLHPVLPWECNDTYHNDGYMSANGWSPVPAKSIVTESEFYDAWNSRLSYRETLTEVFGITVIPDPEPTNTDNLTELMKEIDQAIGLGVAPRTVAKYLNDNGVTAPNVKGN